MDKNDIYKTIEKASEGFFKDRLSKFYAFAYPVENIEQIKNIREQIKKKHYNARHQAYAFIINPDNKIYRYSDDGEPSNSSGPPIYNAIKSFDLCNILIIVVRYFGGKKLGIPGLINAYRTAAENAIMNANIIEKILEEKITIKFHFDQMNFVMNSIKKFNLSIVEQKFTENCLFTISFPKSEKEKIFNHFDKNQISILS